MKAIAKTAGWMVLVLCLVASVFWNRRLLVECSNEDGPLRVRVQWVEVEE